MQPQIKNKDFIADPSKVFEFVCNEYNHISELKLKLIEETREKFNKAAMMLT